MASATASDRERAEELKRIIEREPSRATEHRDEIIEGLLAQDPYVREIAARALVPASVECAFDLRPRVNTILTRLDDSHRTVRINSQLIIRNLAQVYPQDFGPGTNVLFDGSQSSNEYEKLASVSALAEIARQRPDLVTPREDVLEELKQVRDDTIREDSSPEAPTIDPDALDEGIEALEGGDLASRPLEDDLTIVGKKTKLSKPARYGLLSLLWVPFIMIGLFLILLLALQVFLSDGKKRQRQRPSRLRGLKYLWKKSQATLYLRQSIYPTPGSVVPVLPGQSVEKRDRRKEQPEKPENWDSVCSAVFERDGAVCRNCEVNIKNTADVDGYIDFKKPHEKGGKPHPANLRVLCGSCLDARSGGRGT